MQLILASTSPYRRQLLSRLQLPFETVAPDFEEQAGGKASAEEIVQFNALGKLRTVAKNYDKACVVASDQVACCDEELLGKPGNFEQAFRQLQGMSGKRITFITGLAMSWQGQERYEAIPYHVQMRNLQDSEISYYLNAERPFDCAGSFKSEGLGVALFEKMEGDDPTALVGLPLIRLSQWLQPLLPH